MLNLEAIKLISVVMWDLRNYSLYIMQKHYKIITSPTKCVQWDLNLTSECAAIQIQILFSDIFISLHLVLNQSFALLAFQEYYVSIRCNTGVNTNFSFRNSLFEQTAILFLPYKYKKYRSRTACNAIYICICLLYVAWIH